MKKIAIVIVVFAVFGLGVPFLGGFIAKQQLDNVVRVLNDNPGYTASVRDYKKTWLRTSATLELVVDVPEPNGATPISIDMPVQLSIGHGPILSDLGYRFGWFSYQLSVSQAQSRYFRQHVTVYNKTELFQIDGYMSIFGTATLNSRSAPFVFASKVMDVSVGASVFAGEMKLSGLLEYSGTIGEVVVSHVDGITVTMAASTLTVNSDYGRLLKGTNLMPSDLSYTTPKIDVASAGGVSTLKSFDMAAVVSLPDANNIVDFSLGLHSKSGTVGGEVYSNFSLELAYSRISVMLFDAYREMIENAVDKRAENTSPVNFFTKDVVHDFLKYKPSVAVKTLKVDLLDGSFTGNFHVNFQPVPNVDAELILRNPVLLLPGIKANMALKVAKPLALRLAKIQSESALKSQLAAQDEVGANVNFTAQKYAERIAENAEATIEMLTTQKLIVDEGGDYKFKFVLDNGQTQINGNVVPLPVAAMLGGGM